MISGCFLLLQIFVLISRQNPAFVKIMRSRIFVVFSLCLYFFPVANQTIAQAKLVSKIGTVNPVEKRFACLAIQNSKLKRGLKIQVVLPDKPQFVKTAVVESKEDKSCSSEIDVASHLSFYKIKMADERELNFGIGIIGSRQIKVVHGIARADINNDGKLEYFRTCTSNEGIHSTVWTGKPLKGKRIWHTYYYLEYDTDPTCKKKDYIGTDD